MLASQALAFFYGVAVGLVAGIVLVHLQNFLFRHE